MDNNYDENILKELENLEDIDKEKNLDQPKNTVDKFIDLIKEGPPLFLPVGSVRAIMALGSILISGILMINGIEVPEWLYSSIVMIVGFYFGTRK